MTPSTEIADQQQRGAEPAVEGRVVLVVEDEWIPRVNLCEELEEMGYDVFTAEDAHEAMAQLDAYGERLYAVLLDVNLGPGPTGFDVAQSARTRFPELPIIFTTANLATPIIAADLGRAVHVNKPYQMREITEALEAAPAL